MKLIRIRDFGWTEDFSFHRYVTCINHPTALYSTKNPFARSIHMLRTAEGYPIGQECPCPFADLAVMCQDDGTPFTYVDAGNWEDDLNAKNATVKENEGLIDWALVDKAMESDDVTDN